MVWRKLRFPNMAMTLMKRESNSRYHPNDVVFKVDPKFTKHDIKEYLTKIYGLNVQKVNTMNYEGKYKRVGFGKYTFKEKNWKKAIVRLGD